jgi:phage shock protein A
MRSLPVIAVLLTVLLVTAGVAAAQALTVKTDKAMYMPGESVVVSGTAVPGATVGIAAYNPAGTTVFFTMVTAGADGSFTTTIKIPKTIPYEDWVYGTYTVEAKVGTTTATTKFTVAAAALIVGTVVDEKGAPVPNAEVMIKETGVSVLTGKDGKFTISVEKEGTWTLVVSKAGYVSTEKKVTVSVGTNDVGVITITSLESVVADLKAKVESLTATVSELSTKVAALEAQVPALTEISAKLDALNASLAALSKAVTDLSSKVDAVSKAVGDVSTKVSGVDAKLADLSKAVNDLSKSVSSLDASVKDALGKVTSTLDALRVDITGLRSDLKTMSDKLGTLATKSDVDAVSKSVASVDAKVGGVSGAVGGLTGAVYAAVILALLAFIMSLLVYMTVRKAIAK